MGIQSLRFLILYVFLFNFDQKRFLYSGLEGPHFHFKIALWMYSATIEIQPDR